MATEKLFAEVPSAVRQPSRKGVWADAIRTLETPDRVIFVEKTESKRAKGSLVQAMRFRKLRLRSQVTSLTPEQAKGYGIDPAGRKSIEGTLFWSERVQSPA